MCATFAAKPATSLPGLTRQSIVFERLLQRWMDARVKPAHDASMGWRTKTTTAFVRGADEGRVDRRVAPEARELAWELFRVPDAVRLFMPLRRAGTLPNTGVRYGPGSAAHRKSAALRPGHGSERQYHIHELLAVARLLHVSDLAAAAIGDAGLGDLA
jgi:hypothetical protein